MGKHVSLQKNLLVTVPNLARVLFFFLLFCQMVDEDRLVLPSMQAELLIASLHSLSSLTNAVISVVERWEMLHKVLKIEYYN